ncbi:transcriptional regulator [Pseudoclavibacter endophyticus]|uniref:Helix-turn-helix domain-containing protein n=1 Tax=Pseudoclavibacter endophyticus TaxID=1778590 RepID=A0A6H9WFW2_9MICO|nr:IclR family transcriptional regulator C-terminal domain-containing protein [Pseudoclavibacter endophyticus]KAB1649849.1 helix-turn-helix domain-containing protein [Pseudoclavibacter endophyticus]GGA59295.1 transcriptional regulator [Pseudoclavibacter endophyticus]
MTEPREPGDEFVQALARGLDVIRAFDASHPRGTLSDVARRTGLSRATVRRSLKTLVGMGYATQYDDQYALTPRVLELGFSYLSSLGLSEVVEPHLRALSAEVGESVNAGILDADRVVYVARVSTRRLMRIHVSVGTRLPAAWTSMGRTLLAALPPDEASRLIAVGPDGQPTPVAAAARVERALERVRRDGYALVDQELEPGLRSIAVPVLAPDGTLACAVNVATSAATTDRRLLEGPILAALRRTATQVETDLDSIAGPPARSAQRGEAG